MPYPDGLPAATSLSSSDLIVVCQGTTGIPGSGAVRSATVAQITNAQVSGVSSFNTRTGAVSLTSSDVTGALAFTPYNSANPSSFQTAAQVATAVAAGVAPLVTNIAALRAITSASPLSSAYITGYTTNSDGGGGTFYLNLTDTTTADNGGTIIVDASGRRWYRDTPGKNYSVRWFGATGNGTTDDTAALNRAKAAINTLYFPAGTYLISSGLSVNTTNVIWTGSADAQTTIKASGNFSALLGLGASAADCRFERIGFTQTGTTTRCVTAAVGSQVLQFSNCNFAGNLTGNLIYSQAAGFLELFDCAWSCNAAGTVGITIDGYNQNDNISGGRAGGIGSFLVVTNTTGNPANGVQGLTVCGGFKSICTANVAINIGQDAYYIEISDCIIDQAAQYALAVGNSANLITAKDSWFGLRAGATTAAVFVDATFGAGFQLANCTIYGGSGSGGACLQVGASGTQRASGVDIIANTFTGATTCSLVLDSVNGCTISNNRELSTPSNGSYNTLTTYGAGSYTFGGNSWHTAAPANFSTTSSYRASNDRGVTLRNCGNATPGSSATTLTINHGLVTTPDKITITANSTGVGNFEVQSVTTTSFLIAWGTAGTPLWYWDAEVHR